MVVERTPGVGRVFEFDDFRLEPDSRQLFRAGELIPLQGKAFEMLWVLVENRGRLLTKDELFNLVWPDQIVEESNLTVNMSAIRKALQERASNPRLITTVSGRGYRFSGNVRELEGINGGELTLESETYSRVIIEREELDDDQLIAAPDVHNLPLLPGPTRKSRLPRFALVLALVAALALASAVWIYRSRNRGVTRVVANAPVTRRFDTHGGVPIRVTISPDGKSLAYIQRLRGHDTLWLGQVDTNASAPVYQQEGLLLDPVTFSPDGSSLYFTVRDETKGPILVRMPALGGPLTELRPGVNSGLTFSPDGKQMAFLRRNDRGNETSIVLADTSDGRSERVLATRRSPEDFSTEGVAWSPDGKSIAAGARRADGNEEILTYDVVTGDIRKVGSRNWAGVTNMVWLPDGSGLLAIGQEEVGALRLRHIWRVSYPEGEVRQITDDLNHFVQTDLSISSSGRLAFCQGQINASIWVAPADNLRSPRLVLQGVSPKYEGVDGLSWTPDGQRLIYSAYVGESLVIWSADMLGGDLRQVTPTKPNASDHYLSASADGNLIVFQSNRSGSMEIWQVGIDGSGLRQLTTGGNNTQPDVSPDGHWIIYVSEREGRRTLWRVNVNGGDSQQLTDYTAIVPKVSPDGRYIAAFISTDTSADYKLAIISFEGGAPQKTFNIPTTVFRGRARMVWEPTGNAIIYKDDPQGLWRQVLNEEQPRPVEGFEEMHMRQLAWSFDGRHLAYASGPATEEIILIDNFR
jgi:Tol biopolymer transport system component/DNA-binding winged helix-turn-helix (wHTH) protein